MAFVALHHGLVSATGKKRFRYHLKRSKIGLNFACRGLSLKESSDQLIMCKKLRLYNDWNERLNLVRIIEQTSTSSCHGQFSLTAGDVLSPEGMTMSAYHLERAHELYYSLKYMLLNIEIEQSFALSYLS